LAQAVLRDLELGGHGGEVVAVARAAGRDLVGLARQAGEREHLLQGDRVEIELQGGLGTIRVE